ncbi:myelin-associated glycoprotein sialoadhesin-like isoform X1 [Solea senegalensis]|uniref:Myelin-associated glycoprotein sialoadhesin-like isoform X1 n=2 Tax=Solea senegalensis TaxID=28829 RepID=A0AAV6PPJ9_SOLSE|nr:myelin-associated glycoprotein-like isoform X2 [Solea senegalensis]KAG7474329.1 myelin-associated glycoprotein sialoadhesin-like isoform X1 [Solea senegalensis]
MDALKWTLFFVWLYINAVQTEASSWSITLPSTVKGLIGSCVVIPCTYNYPDHKGKADKFTGIWTDSLQSKASHFIYHPDASKVVQQYQTRAALLGDVTHKNCTLKIDPLQQSDQGPFYFRVEMANFNNYTYKEKVSITVFGALNIDLSVKEVQEGQTALASCSVSPACPTSLPVFSWSHPGEEYFHSMQFEDGQWKATATLTFHPTKADHNKPLLCTVRYDGGRQQETTKLLKVKHAPVNVMVEYKSDVKEGEAVQLKCSSDAYPPANSYEWYNETGVQMHQGNTYMIPNVSRNMDAFYCTAINTVGRGKSSPMRLSVLYAPEIKMASSCSSRGDVVKCMCIVESKPPSMVHFVIPEKVFAGTKIERHGSVTIGTLQAEFGSSEVVHCLANNTIGIASFTLSLPVNDKMHHLFIAIATGAGVVLMILLIAVVFVIKWRSSGDAPTLHIQTNKGEELPEYATANSSVLRKEMNCGAMQWSASYSSDNVYGNMETDNDAIYANV